MAEVPEQADVDPVAATLAWFKAHQQVATLLGDPALHVSGIHEAAWPHLIISEGVAADLRRGDWDGEFEVAFHLVGHPNGAPGKAELRRLAAKLMAVALRMPDEMPAGPTDPVVSRAKPSGSYVYQPLASGQPSYHFAVLLVVRPPLEFPAGP